MSAIGRLVLISEYPGILSANLLSAESYCASFRANKIEYLSALSVIFEKKAKSYIPGSYFGRKKTVLDSNSVERVY
jgi:hypothetical protein